MRWRDIRFEKPTEADVDEFGGILQLLDTGSICRWNWKSTLGSIAWMPTSELPAFNRIPDPPEGWRFVASSDVDRADVRWWDSQAKDWKDCGAWSAGFPFDKNRAYIVPIDPPSPPEGYKVATESDSYDGMIFYCPIDRKWKPVPATSGRKIEPGWYAVPTKQQYRAFASREEAFARFGEPVKKLCDGTISRQTELYPDGLRIGPMAYRYSDAFDVWVYMDGSPFGVKVVPFQP